MDRCLSSLSVSRKKLLQTMQRNPFSNIDTVISGGDPQFNLSVKITREIKLGIETPVKMIPDDADFVLKKAVTDLFDYFDGLRDGTAVTIEVRHGLPARLILAGEV